MAISCFVEDDGITIDVDDPGYGYVRVWVRPVVDGEDLELSLRGRYMWRALRNLTELALTENELDPGSAYDVDGLWRMTVRQAGRLLPAMQTAVMYAAAGSDRAERLDDDEDGTEDVLCVRCNLGSPYTGHVTESADCVRYGHQPFGYAGHWESAEDAVNWNRRWAEIHQRNAESVTVPADAVGQPE